ncbi:hypothetical protein [Marimonas arenosa]|uniref:Uncharacterized protein n=1 Tax=Marimonas arenosa TaxID=1795305 RepID=A0AAE3WFB5_9RHOB|nr:hypothetical protein [Marimonas arenosa]MDQ2091677.1 hypothetical protein [Marimonas arenosa]
MTLADTQSTDLHSHINGDKGETGAAVKLIFTVLVLLVAWGVSIFKWGVPGLYIPAVAFTPLMYLLLITIARG